MTEQRWRIGTPAWPKVPFIPAHVAPGWLFELEKALVEASLCDWQARTAPHPQQFAMLAAHFFETRLMVNVDHNTEAPGGQ